MRMRFLLLPLLCVAFSGVLSASALAVTISVVATEQPRQLGDSVELDVLLEIPAGEQLFNVFWSVDCMGCTLTNFMFAEALFPGSGLVQWTATQYFAPFAAGGTQTNLNTSGSFAHIGDGKGTVLKIPGFPEFRSPPGADTFTSRTARPSGPRDGSR